MICQRIKTRVIKAINYPKNRKLHNTRPLVWRENSRDPFLRFFSSALVTARLRSLSCKSFYFFCEKYRERERKRDSISDANESTRGAISRFARSSTDRSNDFQKAHQLFRLAALRYEITGLHPLHPRTLVREALLHVLGRVFRAYIKAAYLLN